MSKGVLPESFLAFTEAPADRHFYAIEPPLRGSAVRPIVCRIYMNAVLN